jgi:hypothetical protein
MMTRKDFDRIAQVFRVAYNVRRYTSDTVTVSAALDDMLDDMCVELKAINPFFDKERFTAATQKGS